VSPPIHDSFFWDRRTLKRGTLHRKKLGTKGLNFSERFVDAGPAGAIFEKFCGKIPHIWQGRRSAAAGSPTDCHHQDCSEVARERTDPYDAKAAACGAGSRKSQDRAGVAQA
jgi:hypothetical protein